MTQQHGIPLTRSFLKKIVVAALQAMAEDPFRYPESTSAPEVMSPNLTTALEGETAGPNYGSVQAAGSSGVLVNGVAGRAGHGPGMSPLREEPRPSTVLEAPGGTLTGSPDATTGPDVSARTTGPDVATYAVGVEARPIRVPQGILGAQQPQQPPELVQPTSTQQHEQPLQRPTMSPQPSNVSTNPSPSQYPEPQQVPPPVQVMRTWTTQMASAAAAVGQRFQIQTVLGQGQVEVREGDVPAGSDGLLDFGIEGQGYHGHLQQDPPPLPPHLRNDSGYEASRPGVFAGLARAGQALRRRVLAPVFQQVSGYPQAPSSLSTLEIQKAAVKDESLIQEACFRLRLLKPCKSSLPDLP